VKLLYLSPDYAAPAGGIRVIYRHVDILRRNGFEAFVVHERRGFRCEWFENDTPVLGWSSRRFGADSAPVQRAARHLRRGLRHVPSDRLFLQLHEPSSIDIAPSDVLVIPEIFGPRLAEIAPGTPKIVFNQNPFFTFRRYPSNPRGIAFAYQHPDVLGTFVISEHSRRFIDYAFPRTRTLRVRWSLDAARFFPAEKKLRRIAYMPRRGAEDGVHVLATLAARGALDGYEIVVIDGMDEGEVASLLRESLVFLSLGMHEGLPLPPAEAMACGAIVVGYDGFGGREYITPDLAFPVPAGDLVQFAETLEHVLALHREQPADLEGKALRAAAFVAEQYSPEREEHELLTVWREMLEAIP
jgi:hypothetical protein